MNLTLLEACTSVKLKGLYHMSYVGISFYDYCLLYGFYQTKEVFWVKKITLLNEPLRPCIRK